MNLFNLNSIPRISNVYYMSEVQYKFSDHYLNIRRREERLYADDLVKNLPYLPKDHCLHNEWRLRENSMKRVLSSLEKGRYRHIIDLGCGNGWFTHYLANNEQCHVFGVDINEIELVQAARLFTTSNCQFIYWNIFESNWLGPKLDLIILNSSIQYFVSLTRLLKKLLVLLSDKGEIHIFDSPIYHSKDVEAAKARSLTYFTERGERDMNAFYHHHCWGDLSEFNYKIAFNPEAPMTRIKRKFFKNDSPFPWIVLKKADHE